MLYGGYAGLPGPNDEELHSQERREVNGNWGC